MSKKSPPKAHPLTFKMLGEYMRETNWTPPPLPDRFLLSYLEGTLEKEEAKILERKLKRDLTLKQRLETLRKK
jgi:MoxR-like ATPase